MSEKRNLPNEIWRRVDSDSYYEVSNKGRIRSWRLQRSPVKKDETPAILKLANGNGYNRVELSIDGESKRYSVHRLVAEAFIPNPNNKKFVNHIDGNKINNCVANLEWCTFRENTDHAIENGLTTRGEVNAKSKLTENEVLDIRNAYRLGVFSQKEIAKAYNVKRQSIWAIVHNKTWSHI